MKLLTPNPRNPRVITPDRIQALTKALKTFGDLGGVVFNRRSSQLVGGHQRITAFESDPHAAIEITTTLPEPDKQGTVAYGHVMANGTRYAYREVDWDQATETAAMLAANKFSGEWEWEGVTQLLKELQAGAWEDMQLTGFDTKEIDALLNPGALGSKADHGALAERFGVPPFSVLDTRQAYWQNRKAAWMTLGMQSELGRNNDLLGKKTRRSVWQGKTTSIFDPVLCELAYRWFCPPGGAILDPFAGGSVRGVVAGYLGYRYSGIELRKEQVEANREQARQILAHGQAGASKSSECVGPEELTPVQKHGEVWYKRDDLCSVAGVRGGKVRTCYALARQAKGLITAGSRMSPQVNIVASIGQMLGVPVRCHVPTGALSPEVMDAKRKGAEIIQHKAGYNNVIIKRARDDAKTHEWTEIPFGMECAEAVTQTRKQVANIPKGVKRIVMAIGSGMSLAGVLWGLKDAGRDIPVVGVQVGADPAERLDAYAPPNWREMVKIEKSDLDYHDPAPNAERDGIEFDPVYEAKALPWLKPGDCFWAVGIRATASRKPKKAEMPVWIEGDSMHSDELAKGEYDFVFSCPPYADLEVYSENPQDLSVIAAGDYGKFLMAYRAIIAKACAMLKPNRFAAFVVGDVRDPQGNYRGFVLDTIKAFTDSGLRYYNEGILINSVGSLALRAGRPFQGSRKLSKTHQTVLIFVKGDGKSAAEAVGPVDFGETEDENSASNPLQT